MNTELVEHTTKMNRADAARNDTENNQAGTNEIGEVTSNELNARKENMRRIKVRKLEAMQIEQTANSQDKSCVQQNNQVEEPGSSVKRTKLKKAWTKKNKRLLLDALKKYGTKNISKISDMLPQIPQRLIKSRIFTYEVLAKYYYEDDLINDWMKCGICRPNDSCIPKALFFIKLLEKQHTSSESKLDYREIYNFIHHAFSFEKQTLPELKQENRKVLLSLLSKIDRKMYPQREKQLWDYLGKIYPRRHIQHVYPGKKNRFDVQ